MRVAVMILRARSHRFFRIVVVHFSDLKNLKLNKQQYWLFSDIVELDYENEPVDHVLIDQSVSLNEFKESALFKEIVKSVF